MPNWCSNQFTVSHEDAAMITKFAEAVRAGTLFETFVPLSSGEWDYSVALNEWGTKWDITEGDCDISEDGKSASGSFETAWGPGIAAYEKLEELGFELNVLYHEPGMCFAGQYIQGEDECVEYDFSNPDWREDLLNDDILELLENEYEHWQMWNDEENEDAEDSSEQSSGK